MDTLNKPLPHIDAGHKVQGHMMFRKKAIIILVASMACLAALFIFEIWPFATFEAQEGVRPDSAIHNFKWLLWKMGWVMLIISIISAFIIGVTALRGGSR
jgi:hypothetical protein